VGVGQRAVEGVELNDAFWRGRRVLITGHTGFKGSWLTRWLASAGAIVTGFSNGIPTEPSLFADARLHEGIESITGDVRDAAAVNEAINMSRAEVVFHMAAQSLVRASYEDPAGTYATNVMGTVNVLDAIRFSKDVRAAVIVTSDKCYEHRRHARPFREDDRLGGKDPYSNSKACAELVTAAYRRSLSLPVVTARAGNVIGGGDWARDRLVPDLVRAFLAGTPALIRNPDATRPWQFVLDALHGYLILAKARYEDAEIPNAWNFGPSADDVKPVRWIADRMALEWADRAQWEHDGGEHPHEASALTLDSTRARTLLHWRPLTGAETALDWTIEWYRAWARNPADARRLMTAQLERFRASS
jgi:CDP-glucose 4,6-dehydratase